MHVKTGLLSVYQYQWFKLLDILNIQYGTEVCNRFCGVNGQELATTLTLNARKNYLFGVPDLSSRRTISVWFEKKVRQGRNFVFENAVNRKP